MTVAQLRKRRFAGPFVANRDEPTPPSVEITMAS
jgi:hypothetical protein